MTRMPGHQLGMSGIRPDILVIFQPSSCDIRNVTSLECDQFRIVPVMSGIVPAMSGIVPVILNSAIYVLNSASDVRNSASNVWIMTRNTGHVLDIAL